MARIIFLMLLAVAMPQEQPSFVSEGDLNAPVADVWKVWTTSDGYKWLGVAKADIDFRVGGLIRAHYGATGELGDDNTIENLIMAYEPQRMIAIRINKPPKSFPYKEAWKRTWTVITLSDLGNNRTHLRVASMGFGNDEESVAMKAFFERGNETTLKKLQEHFDSVNPKPRP